MDSILKPIERLAEDLKWFVANTDLKAIHVAASADLRAVVLNQIEQAEMFPRNNALFLSSDAPGGDDASWDARRQALMEAFEEVRNVAVGPAGEQPVPFGSLPELDPRTAPLTRFGVQVRDVARAAVVPGSPMTGVVIVLCPTDWGAAPKWSEGVSALARQEIAHVRWVVLEGPTAPSRAALSTALGAALLTSDAVLDPAGQREDLRAMIGALAAAPPGVVGPQAVGMPGPRCAPPRRKREPAPPQPGELEKVLRDAGVPEGYADDAGLRQLRLHMMSAGLAFGEGDHLTGIREQRAARDQAIALGLLTESVVLEQMLGAFTLQAGFSEQAREVFENAYGRAEELGLARQMVLARISVASTWMLQRKPSVAIVQYTEAGRLAAEHGETIMAIEGYRIAGELLAMERRDHEAAQLWQLALQVAEAGEALPVSMSSAPHAARALAALCRSKGLVVQAESLEAQAARLETPPEPPGAVEPGPDDVQAEGV
ncbi:MAG: hypothetical protein H6726_24620 [Sandaracinaceae bacterium]|nr:hypothetical protein [Sandaracinaceae bacterium]